MFEFISGMHVNLRHVFLIIFDLNENSIHNYVKMYLSFCSIVFLCKTIVINAQLVPED